MFRRARERFETNGLFRSVVCWLILAFLAWLDSGRHVGAQHAAVFAFIVEALVFVWNGIETVVTIVATSLVEVVGWLVSTVGWLAKRLAHVVLSSGAIFARAWEGLRIVWQRVLKPALLWVDRTIVRVETWLKNTFKPVFDFLKVVRNHLDAIYKRFLRPVLDLIAFERQLNSALHVLHIHILDKTTATLQAVEGRIDAVELWTYRQISAVANVLNQVVTADGFFVREALLRSMARDLVYVWRQLVNPGMRDITADDRMLMAKAFSVQSPDALMRDLNAHAAGQPNEAGASVDAMAKVWVNGLAPGG